MKIEWDSDNTDSRGRRPKASTVHGWLAKMRGTLIGDEKLRSRGMREMREARAVRAYKKEARRRHRKGNGLWSLFCGKKSSSSRSSGRVVMTRGGQRSRHHSTSHRLVGYVTHKPSGSRGSTSTRSRGSRHTHHSTSQSSRHKR